MDSARETRNQSFTEDENNKDVLLWCNVSLYLFNLKGFITLLLKTRSEVKVAVTLLSYLNFCSMENEYGK